MTGGAVIDDRCGGLRFGADRVGVFTARLDGAAGAVPARDSVNAGGDLVDLERPARKLARIHRLRR